MSNLFRGEACSRPGRQYRFLTFQVRLASMAAAQVSPKKRQRRGSGQSAASVIQVESLVQLQRLEESQIESLVSLKDVYLLWIEPKLRHAVGGGGGGSSAAVLNLIVGDSGGFANVALWRDTASKNASRLIHLADSASDGEFVRLDMTKMKVTRSKPVTCKSMLQLHSTFETLITMKGCSTLALAPDLDLFLQDYRQLEQEEGPIAVVGVIANLSEEGVTQQGNPSQSGTLFDEQGLPLPFICVGENVAALAQTKVLVWHGRVAKRSEQEMEESEPTASRKLLIWNDSFVQSLS